MNVVVIYLLLTTALALMQVRENYSAYLAKLNSTSFSMSFTAIEFIWVFVSIAFLILADASMFEASVAVIYITYNVCGWVLGLRLFKSSNTRTLDLSIIPDSYYFGAMFVCALLFGYGAYVLVRTLQLL